MIFALPPTAIWEISNYRWNSDDSNDVDLYYYTLIHIAAVTFMLILLLGDVVKYSFVDTLIKNLCSKLISLTKIFVHTHMELLTN